MKLELAQVVTAWPLGVSLAVAGLVQSLYAGRRRSALNEAVHELRRPLQALALVAPAAPAGSVGDPGLACRWPPPRWSDWSVRSMAEGAAPMRAPLAARPLLESAVKRWQARAALAGGSLTLRWLAGASTVEGDRGEIAQAIDNLVVNAIEHGGPEIVVAARAGAGRLCLSVLDSGRGSRPESRRESPAELIARLTGRRRRGHGLRVVRRIVTDHGGDFRLRSSAHGTEAVLELPLAGAA